jgi:hypothetical protein
MPPPIAGRLAAALVFKRNIAACYRDIVGLSTGTQRSSSGTAIALSDSNRNYEPQSFSRRSDHLAAGKMLRRCGASAGRVPA